MPGTETVNAGNDPFEGVVRQHQRMIYSLCYRMTGSAADAEDLAQETFISAHRHLAAFRHEARLSSWLYRIAINLCLNWQKREQRSDRLRRQWAEEKVLDQRAGTSPDRSQQIQQALLQLDEKQRAAIILTVYEGLNHAQAARALGCSEKTVSWRIFVARRKLKRLLMNMEAPHE